MTARKSINKVASAAAEIGDTDTAADSQDAPSDPREETPAKSRAKKTPSRRKTASAPGHAAPPGADDETASAGASATPAAAEGRPFDGGFTRWLEAADRLGLEPGQRVWELHVVQGRSIGETGRLLGLAADEVTRLCVETRTRLADRAPRVEVDFQAVREELRDRLVSILEDASRARDDPRLLAVRQRVCDQIADLYGLKMQRRAAADDTPAPYVEPAAISSDVQRVWARVHGRQADIENAQKGLQSVSS